MPSTCPEANSPSLSEGASSAVETPAVSYRRQSSATTPFLQIDRYGRERTSLDSDESIHADGVPAPAPAPEKLASRYKSHTLTGRVEKPWLESSSWHRARFVNNAIVITGFVLSLIVSFWLVWDGYWSSVPAGKYCLIMDDQFDVGLNREYWSYETQIGGFEHEEFSWATVDKQNVFVDDKGLHIVPTLTTESTDITEAQLLDGYTVNLTSGNGGWGTCTSPDVNMCAVRSNSTLGRIIPPVRSARITTKGKKSIKYGRVEVVAKMPKGDWLWPAIWMMPDNSVYGAWPRSGEISIAELRGNDRHYPRGRDLVTSTLHFGPDSSHDGFMETYDTFFFNKKRTDFSDGFYTYGFEWYKDYMYMYVNHKPIFAINSKGKKTFWDRGRFQGMASRNGTMADNPWRDAESLMAPFDQAFHLNLKVAVGAQHGYFYDGKFNKPWVDRTPLAAREFWSKRGEWLPTWGNGTERGMTVKSIRMWQQCE